jgi:hypothetical protein
MRRAPAVIGFDGRPCIIISLSMEYVKYCNFEDSNLVGQKFEKFWNYLISDMDIGYRII